MTTPQIIMTVLLTLRFVGPLARSFGAEFPIRKPTAPWADLVAQGLAVATFAGLLAWGGFWRDA